MREKRFAHRADRHRSGVDQCAPNPAKLLFAGEFYYLICRADCHANDMLRFDAPYRNVELSRVSVTLSLRRGRSGREPASGKFELAPPERNAEYVRLRPGAGPIGFDRLCISLLVGSFWHRVPSRCC
jgi:hypothetical protein